MMKTFCIVTVLFLFGITAKAQSGHLSTTGNLKFIDYITINTGPVPPTITEIKEPAPVKSEMPAPVVKKSGNSNSDIESADELQFKYALLINTEVEMLKNLSLLRVLDEWLGTRYRLGGTTKLGIDCSAFMQVLFTSLYGLAIPRTARDQYKASRKVSQTEIKEGDLVFFNTRGGVSHVGMYLQNNMFIHASSSKGVTISSLYENYYAKRIVGIGRMENCQQ